MTWKEYFIFLIVMMVFVISLNTIYKPEIKEVRLEIPQASVNVSNDLEMIKLTRSIMQLMDDMKSIREDVDELKDPEDKMDIIQWRGQTSERVGELESKIINLDNLLKDTIFNIRTKETLKEISKQVDEIVVDIEKPIEITE